MFKCQKCEALEEEVKFLRQQATSLTDRLIALTDIRAFEAVRMEKANPKDFYGTSEDDQFVSYDQYGQRVLMEKDIELK